MKKCLFVIFLIALSALPIYAFAKSEKAMEAENAIAQAEQDMAEMAKSGFNIIRVNDSLSEAKQVYQAQLALEETGGVPDYSQIIGTAKGIRELKKKASEVFDEIKALELKIAELEGIDTKEISQIFERAKKELKDERYDEAKKAIDDTYKKIIEVQAVSSRLSALYEASTKTIMFFVAANWPILLAIAIASITGFVVFHKRFSIYRIMRKIKSLELEKQVIKDLLRETQKDYFEKKTLSESTFHIRLKKLSELARDIERRIPICKEELAKYGGKSLK